MLPNEDLLAKNRLRRSREHALQGFMIIFSQYNVFQHISTLMSWAVKFKYNVFQHIIILISRAVPGIFRTKPPGGGPKPPGGGAGGAKPPGGGAKPPGGGAKPPGGGAC